MLPLPAFAKFGARFLARGGETHTPDGPAWERHVVIEFDTLEAARARSDGARHAEIFVTEGC